MAKDPEYIPGGYVLLARQVLESGIMEKPPLYFKLWIWMLLQASHQQHKTLKRGQFFTSIDKMREAMKYKVGYRTVRPSRKEIRGVYEALTKGTMIGTTKGTRGLLITILNYDYFQTPSNYEGHNEGHSEGPTRGTLKTRREQERTRKEQPAVFSPFLQRYKNPDLLDRVFAAIASTRKLSKVSDSVLIAQLQEWEQYPAEQVEAGIQIYLNRDYAGQGKREAYLLGIIKNQQPNEHEPESTGSPALDAYYREQGK